MQCEPAAAPCTGKHSCITTTVQDADLDLAAKNIIKGGYSYSGQRCTAVKVVLALEPIADELVKKVCSGSSENSQTSHCPLLLHHHYDSMHTAMAFT